MTAPRAVPTLAVESFGRVLPGWSVRVLVAAVCTAVVALMAVDDVPRTLLGVAGFVSLAVVVSPGSAAAAGLSVLAAMTTAGYAHGGPLRPAVFGMVFLVHLLHVSGGLAAVLPRGARLHLSALRRPALRFAAVQGGALAIAGLAVLVPTGRVPDTLEVAALLAVAAMVGLTLVLLRRR